jgi:mannose-6-phosphate isomerase-like protein (cupin superfamily)
MPRTSESEIDLQDQGPVAARETELADMTASFVTFKEETDMAPILVNLPTRSCQCPHWGVLNKGRVTVRYDDGRSEVIEPGDLYYMTPGHVPVFAAGTELIMFSPTAEAKATDEAIQAFMASQQTSA